MSIPIITLNLIKKYRDTVFKNMYFIKFLDIFYFISYNHYNT